jgi:hypothetical protein
MFCASSVVCKGTSASVEGYPTHMCHVTVWMVLASSDLPVFAQHHLFDLAAQHHLFGLVKCPGLDGLERFV